MKKFMINIMYGDPRNAAHPSEDHFTMQKYKEWSEKIKSHTLLAHKLIDCEGRRLDMKNGRITDGPYAETKESIGGFYLIQAESYDEAVEMAKGCPTLLYQGGYVEVREVEI